MTKPNLELVVNNESEADNQEDNLLEKGENLLEIGINYYYENKEKFIGIGIYSAIITGTFFAGFGSWNIIKPYLN